jgi:hypothetical protein
MIMEVSKMTDQVVCHKGKCWEIGSTKPTHFEVLFDESNIVDQIEKELWERNLY